MVVIEMEDGGKIKIELCPKEAPLTVANFEKLVNEHFYDGLIFHRVIKNFMIQGGDPTGTGAGGSNENIRGEFRLNGVNNTLKHTRGTISMREARILTLHHPSSSSSTRIPSILTAPMPLSDMLSREWTLSTGLPPSRQTSTTDR